MADTQHEERLSCSHSISNTVLLCHMQWASLLFDSNLESPPSSLRQNRICMWNSALFRNGYIRQTFWYNPLGLTSSYLLVQLSFTWIYAGAMKNSGFKSFESNGLFWFVLLSSRQPWRSIGCAHRTRPEFHALDHNPVDSLRELVKVLGGPRSPKWLV